MSPVRIPFNIQVALVGLIASVLLFGNLGDQSLWQDEAQTALVSMTILHNGTPRGFDGTNYFSQELGAEYGDDYLWKWHPWLPFYVLAGFFKVFGTSTLVARLPFALFGLATVVLVYFMCDLVFRNQRTGIFGAFLLSTSVPFLLISRQCRYYAPEMFFCLCSLYTYLRAMETGRRIYYVLYSLSLVLIFHTHQLFYIVSTAVTVIHAALFYRHRIKYFFVAVAASAGLNLPWLYWVYNADYTAVYPSMVNSERFLAFLRDFSVLAFRHMFGPVLFLAAILAAVLLRIKSGRIFPRYVSEHRGVLLIVMFIISGILATSVSSFGLFFRYLAPLIPACATLAGGLIGALGTWNRVLAIGTVVIHLAVSPIPKYLYEITHHYDGPIEGIVKYLQENAAKGDIVAVTYEDLPIKWYTGLRVVGGLTGEELAIAKDARWVIFRKYTISGKDLNVKNYLSRHLDPRRYDKIILDYPDLPFENREEPDLHHFRTVREEDRVVIYRRVD